MKKSEPQHYKMADSRYAKGKIYAIRSFKTDKFYIGSTCLDLSKRFYQHKQKFSYNNRFGGDYMTSAELFKLGIEDCYIELIEEYKCESRMQLQKREGELIRQHKDQVVNYLLRSSKEEQLEAKKEQTRNWCKTKRMCELCKKEVRQSYWQDHIRTTKHINNI